MDKIFFNHLNPLVTIFPTTFDTKNLYFTHIL
jgi:hypothetical protein